MAAPARGGRRTDAQSAAQLPDRTIRLTGRVTVWLQRAKLHPMLLQAQRSLLRPTTRQHQATPGTAWCRPVAA
jgi:hypothetical protein